MCVLVRGVPRLLCSRLENLRSMTGEHLALGDPPSYEQRFGTLVSSTPFFYKHKAFLQKRKPDLDIQLLACHYRNSLIRDDRADFLPRAQSYKNNQ